MTWSRFFSAAVLSLCAVQLCAGAIRFEFLDVTVAGNAATPTSGFFDVVVRADPADLPQNVGSYNVDFHVEAPATLGMAIAAPNPLFPGAPLNFSPPNSQTVRAAQDSFPTSVPLFDGAGLVRVPFEIPAGLTGEFDLQFGIINQLTNATAIPLPLQTTDTGKITITLAFPLGDYNHSGSVEPGDYTTWRSTFGSTSNLNADGNGNNIVDAADYIIWRNQLSPGSGAAESSAISTPEPSIVLCVGLLVTFFAYTRNCRRCFRQ
jgi:hypothetical protein